VRLTLAALAGITILFGTPAYADPVEAGDIIQLRLTTNDGSSIVRFSNGGPFRFDLPGTADDFLTFCLEYDEYFTPGENLLVGSISDQALRGGLNTDSGDFISGTTAFLYTQFRSGVAGYSNGVLLQEAIWFLENERSSVSAATANLIAQAQSQMALVGWGLDDIGDVRVANLYRGSNFATHAQDMLIITPTSVPEPGTLLLLGIGLAGTGAFRRLREVRS
jgi:hypothetical protein